jgi:hypothetical protein
LENQRSNRLHVSAVAKMIRTHFHLMKKDSGLGPVTVNLKRRKEKNQANGAEGIEDMVVESGTLGNM